MGSPAEKLDSEIDYSLVLRQAADEILAVKKQRNQSWLARESGVAPKTLSRFLKGEVAKMSPVNMTTLAKFFINESNVTSLKAETAQALKLYLGEHEVNPLFDRGNENLVDKIERYLVENQDDAVLVYTLCTNHDGVSHKVIHNLGERCRYYLEEYLKLGWVKEINNRYKAIDDDLVINRSFLLQRLAKIYIDRCHPELWNKKQQGESKADNLMLVYQESISPQAMEKITQIMVSASNAIEKVMFDDASQGELPCSVVLFHDILSRQNS